VLISSISFVFSGSKRPRLSTAHHQQHLESVSAFSGRAMQQQEQLKLQRVCSSNGHPATTSAQQQ
jgi:hypothetical protein